MTKVAVKGSPKRTDSRNVNAYIRTAPRESREKSGQLRRIINSLAPEAKEGISYKIPCYNYRGSLVWFAAFKNHIGIFLRPPVIAEHKQELKGYVTTKSAVHFPMDKPLPVALIRKLVRARMAKNKASMNKNADIVKMLWCQVLAFQISLGFS